jgi:hypothetical protein
MYKLDFTNPDLTLLPPLKPTFTIAVKCIVKQVFQTNITQQTFEYKIGQVAVAL